jgi:hypothetical protein
MYTRNEVETGHKNVGGGTGVFVCVCGLGRHVAMYKEQAKAKPASRSVSDLGITPLRSVSDPWPIAFSFFFPF